MGGSPSLPLHAPRLWWLLLVPVDAGSHGWGTPQVEQQEEGRSVGTQLSVAAAHASEMSSPGEAEVEAKRLDILPRGTGYESATAIGPDGAFVDCPCKSSPLLESIGDGERGASCRKWNQGENGVCHKHEPPSWCEAKWCYVDPYTCKRSHTGSSVDKDSSYSYETCGDLGSHYVDWSMLPLTNKLKRPLNVFAGGFWITRAQPTREDMPLNMRASLAFAAAVLTKLGVDYEDEHQLHYKNLSEHSRRRYPESQYTACVYDIALGNLDLCLGPIWDTDERRAMNVSFTGSVFVEEMYLLMDNSWRIKRHTWLTILLKTLEPFTWGLWALIAATILLSSFAMLTFEHWLSPSLKDSTDRYERTKGFTLTAWLHSFLAGEVTFMPATSGGKIFSVGYGFFVLVCISCYTANMATILIGADHGGSRVQTIRDALSTGQRVCYHAALPMSTVKLLYPGLAKLGHKVDGSRAGLSVWEETNCSISIISDMMMADIWADRAGCNYFLTSKPVLIIPNGFYSTNALAHEFSWMASKLRMDGTWDQILNKMWQPSLCAEAEDSNSQLSASHMLGALLVLLGCFAAGLLVHFFELTQDFEFDASFSAAPPRSLEPELTVEDPSHEGSDGTLRSATSSESSTARTAPYGRVRQVQTHLVRALRMVENLKREVDSERALLKLSELE